MAVGNTEPCSLSFTCLFQLVNKGITASMTEQCYNTVIMEEQHRSC